jgi:hypothetical protein
MRASNSRRRRRPYRDLGADRAIIAAVLLSVTTVLLMIGFAGPSIYFVLPGPRGWLYIGVVLVAAASALVRLYFADKWKRGGKPGVGTLSPRSKRRPLP